MEWNRIVQRIDDSCVLRLIFDLSNFPFQLICYSDDIKYLFLYIYIIYRFRRRKNYIDESIYPKYNYIEKIQL